MISFLINYVTLGILVSENLERTKNVVSYTAAKTRYEYLQKYDKEIPYALKYSKATVFLVMVLIWPLLIPMFFRDVKDPNEDFSKSD